MGHRHGLGHGRGLGGSAADFVGPTPIPEDALAIIRDTIDEIDFWEMAQHYDNGD